METKRKKFGAEKYLLGKLVKPVLKNTATNIEDFQNSLGIVIVAEWDDDDRLLYTEMLCPSKKIVKRTYSSLSTFKRFFEIVEI